METMRLFKTLQKHVADINEIVAKLYNEQIGADDAKARAVKEIESTLAKIKDA